MLGSHEMRIFSFPDGPSYFLSYSDSGHRNLNRGNTSATMSRRAVVRPFASRPFTLSAVRAAEQSPRGTWAMALPNRLGGLLRTTNRLPGLHSRAESSQSKRALGREQQNRTTTVSH